ncbi:MAG: shikimate kinase [Eubacteriales bacterium]|nr:shikimate kinase [Eubacteriales bacterium]
MKKLQKHIFLIGFMGVGKTSTSRELNRMLGVQEIDTDAVIVEQECMAINEIFAGRGEEYFRQVETELIDSLKTKEPCIVSCGGGMVMRQENVAAMKEQGTICLLTASPETIYEHVKDSTDRPLLVGHMNIPYITEMMQAREPKYRAAADVVVDTDGCSPAEVAKKLIAELG